MKKKQKNRKRKNPISPADVATIAASINRTIYANMIGEAILEDRFTIDNGELIVDLRHLSPSPHFRPKNYPSNAIN